MLSVDYCGGGGGDFAPESESERKTKQQCIVVH